jgi:hypothetical protein
VTLDVQANKLRADGTGKESEVAMNDLVEIGVFDAAEKPLYLQKHRIRSGLSRITVRVSGKPAKAGIDPRLYLIDRNWSDNTRVVAR